MASGGSAALRGFRLQTLYALYYLLNRNTDKSVLRLEGEEDLECISSKGAVTHYMQVKAYSTPLTLSAIDYAVTASGTNSVPPLFKRVLLRCERNPDATQQLVIIGELGKELAGAWAGDPQHRAAVASKLSQRYTQSEIERLFTALAFEVVDPTTLEGEVLKNLAQGRMGGDPQSAIEILQAWLHRLSEQQALVTQDMLTQKLERVSKYLAQRAAHHEAWYRSIFPLIVESGVETRGGTLEREFYEAFAARFEHIAAGVDIERPDRLEEIRRGFSNGRVVVIHGASGQGKSALAYRFLFEHVPSPLRFEVPRLQDGTQADTIALALLEEASVAGEAIFILVDVPPGNTAWVDLVAKLSRYPDARVLVTVREEDWAAGVSLRAKTDCETVRLEFGRDEARELFARLVTHSTPPQIFDFDDAWGRFEPPGPLLEFVYLVTRNERLSVRLEAQVRGIEQDIQSKALPPESLRLLHAVAVASSYGARVDLARLLKQVEIVQPRFVLRRLEGEYLVRVTHDQSIVEGLHPIRSELLMEILEDAIVSPWPELSALLLNCIVDADLETFLLHAFSRRPASVSDLLREVHTHPPRTWTALGGTLRALQWLDIKHHVELNGSLVDDVHAYFQRGWIMALRWDITGQNERIPGSNTGIDWTSFGWKQEKIDALNTFNGRHKNELATFEASTHWLNRLSQAPNPPLTDSDWLNLADVCYWANFRALQWNGVAWFQEFDFSGILTLPLQVAAQVISGFWHLLDDSITQGCQSVFTQTFERFQLETRTFAVIKEENAVTAHYLYPMSYVFSENAQAGSFGDAAFNEASMDRVELLRFLLPGFETYGAQGYGHQSLIFTMPFDSTRKAVPVTALPPATNVRLNGTFLGLANHRFRVKEWAEYANTVMDLRQRNLEHLHWLIGYMERHFARESPELFEDEPVDAVCSALNRFPDLPSCAFDEFGFTSEGREVIRSDTLVSVSGQTSVAKRQKSYSSLATKVFSAMTTFHQFSYGAFFLNPLLALLPTKAQQSKVAAKFETDDSRQQTHLASSNLDEVLKDWTTFQAYFNRQYSKWIPDVDLITFDRIEYEAVLTLTHLWFRLIYASSDRYREPQAEAKQLFLGKLESRRDVLTKAFRRLGKQGIRAKILSESALWNGESALWLIADIDDPVALYRTYSTLYTEVSLALQWGSDRAAQTAITLYWSHVVIVPTIRGKALDAQAWSLSTILLYGNQSFNDAGDYRFALQAVTKDVWDTLSVEIWETDVRTRTFLMAHQQAVRLFALWSFLAAIGTSPDPTGNGQFVVDEYIKDVQKLVEAVCSEALQAMKDLQQACEGDERRMALSDSILSVMQTMESLIEHQNLTRLDFRDNSDAIAKIADALETARLTWYAASLP